MNLESDILDNAVIYFLFFYLFLFVLIKLINYKKNVVNFMQMQTNEPYPDPAIEMDLKRVLYFFPLDLIYVLSYKKSFICTIIFEKLFASLVDQRQVGFCRQSSPSGCHGPWELNQQPLLLLGILSQFEPHVFERELTH